MDMPRQRLQNIVQHGSAVRGPPRKPWPGASCLAVKSGMNMALPSPRLKTICRMTCCFSLRPSRSFSSSPTVRRDWIAGGLYAEFFPWPVVGPWRVRGDLDESLFALVPVNSSGGFRKPSDVFRFFLLLQGRTQQLAASYWPPCLSSAADLGNRGATAHFEGG